MKNFGWILSFLLFTLSIKAQNFANDCVSAIVICGNENIVSNATGIGNTQEINGCGSSEHNSIWIKINIVQAGTLGFNLIPSDPDLNVDYDFWVFGPNKNCGTTLGNPIRCNTVSPLPAPFGANLSSNHTGMNGSTLSTQSGPGPGSSGSSGYVRWLDVLPGQFYYIAIDRPGGEGGFELEWIGSAMDGTGAFPSSPTANIIPDYEVCSSTPNLGIFDLDSVRASINSDLTSNEITFYETYDLAFDEIEPLTNIINNTSNPQTIFAKVKNNITECFSITSFNLVVNPIPEVEMSVSNSSICIGEEVTVTFTGTPGGVVQYQINLAPLLSATLESDGTYSFSQTIPNTTVFSLNNIKTFDNVGGVICTQQYTNTITVTATPVPTATISYTATSFCMNSTSVQNVSLTGTNAFENGTFSALPTGLLINSNTGAITPNGSLEGEYEITYTIPASGSCAAILVTTLVTITAVPTATISYTDSSFCSNTTNVQNVSLTGTNAFANGTFSALPTGLLINPNTGAITPNGSLAGDYEITYAIPASGGCASIPVTTLVSIIPVPTATISYAATSFCMNTTNVQNVSLTGTNAFENGTFSALPTGLLINSNTGAITPNGSLAGEYEITYTIPASGGCEAIPVTTLVSILLQPTLTLTSEAITTNQTICVNTPIVPIQYTFDSGATGVVVTGLPAGIGYIINGNIVTISGIPITTAAIFNYSITATSNSCGTPVLSGVIEVTNGILPIFAQVTPVCQGSTVNIPTSSTNTPPILGVWNLISSTANDVTYEFTPNAGQCALPTWMTIVAHPLPIVSPSVTSQSFCSGGTTNINLVSDVLGSEFYWTVSGTSVTGQSGSVTGSGATSINQTLTLNANQVTAGQVTYNIVAQTNGCFGAPVTVVVTVNPIPNVIISPASHTQTICSGETTNISFSGAINNTVYTWSVVSSVGVSGAFNGVSTSINQILTTTGPSQGTVVYEVTPSLNGCPGTPETITVTVNPVPELFVSTTHGELCSGESTNISVSPFNAATVFNWVVESNGVSGASAGTDTGLSINIVQTLTTTGNTRGYVDYIITPVLTDCSGIPTTVRVYVNPLPVVYLTDGTICVDTAGIPFQNYVLDSGLNDEDYNFVWTFEGNTILGSTSATHIATEVGTYTVVATNSTTNCESNVASAEVSATNPATSLTVTQSEYFSDNATLTVTVTGGNGILLYQLDQGILQESNMFTAVTGGTHTITVVDIQGCTYLIQEVLVIDYPKYFTPNGDGHNDTWNIIGLNQSDAILYIFDRYGKLLKQIVPSTLSNGWDGMYNNTPMPSTDYWFTLDYTENGTQKQYKAHFSLKR
jgi:gliding motility-associated-like protein